MLFVHKNIKALLDGDLNETSKNIFRPKLVLFSLIINQNCIFY